MRLLLALAAGFALAVVPALASDTFVTATADNRFTPAEARINPGDEVVWSNQGFHNVKFEDGSFEYPAEPSNGWQETSRIFNEVGTFAYLCEAHPDMKGTVVVEPKKTTTTTTTTGTTTTTTTTTTITETTPTTTTTQTAPQGTPPPPVVGVTPIRSRFCARASRRCRKVGVYLRITSDTPHRAKGTLRRNGRAYGTVFFDLPAGTKFVRFRRTSAGRRIVRGQYRLKVGTAPAVRFRVI